MKKRLLSLILIFGIIGSLFVVYATDESFKVTVASDDERIGNAYYGDENPTFNITMENKSVNTQNVTLEIKLSNDEKVVITTESKNVTLEGGAKKIIGYVPNFDKKFGVYTVEVKLYNDLNTATSEIKFSYTEKNNGMLDELGFSCHFSKSNIAGMNYESIGKAEKILKESGAGWIRDEINWSSVEQVKGKYVIPKNVEDYVNTANRNGQKVMLLVTGGNKLYETGKGPNGEVTTCLPLTKDGIQGFTNFAVYVANYFKGRVDTFEIWNEPDWVSFNGHYDWLPDDKGESWAMLAEKSAAAYANLIKSVYPAIKNVYKGEEDKVTVVSGGGLPIRSETGYMGQMLATEGVQDCIDAVAVHTYSLDATPADMCSGGVQDFTLQLRKVKNMTKKPIYITEYGASSYGDSTNGGVDSTSEFKGYGIFGINGQAMALVGAYMVVANDPQIERLFIYNFKEKGDTPSIENNFGVIDFNYIPKRAYAALSTMTSLLKDAEPKNKIAATESNYAYGNAARIYEFKDQSNGNDIFVIGAGGSAFEWTTKLNIKEDTDASSSSASVVLDNTNKKVTVNAYNGGEVKVYDILGNEIQATYGAYPIYLSPMYVVCSKPAAGVNVDDKNVVKVEGRGGRAFSDITALVIKKNAIGNRIVYVEQLKTDSTGKYDFEFAKNDGDIYDICVYDGSVYQNNSCDTEDYDIDMKFYADEQEIINVSDIQIGMKVKLRVELSKKNPDARDLIAYGTVSDGNGVLLDAKKSTSSTDDGKTVLTTEIDIASESDVETIRFMLWDEMMHPIINTAKVQ